MRYSAAGHAVNILFILAVVLAPISICLANPSIPVEVVRRAGVWLGAAIYIGLGIVTALTGVRSDV
jgi:hypothetical protein